MPVITDSDFRDNVFTAFEAFWASRSTIAWPNVEFNPEDLDEYIEVQLIGDPEGQLPVGTSIAQQTKRRRGTVAFSIYVRENTSLDTAYARSNAVKDFLSTTRAISNTNFTGIGQQEVGPDGVFFQVNVTASYAYYTDRS